MTKFRPSRRTNEFRARLVPGIGRIVLIRGPLSNGQWALYRYNGAIGNWANRAIYAAAVNALAA